jgi:predicted transcriptional regulator of viral defense system
MLERIVKDTYFDGNGCFTERVEVGGQEIIIHYDDIPETDKTTVDGIPVTTALRTVIDLAPEVDRATLERMLEDALARKLFTVEEAWARLAQRDMLTRPGAEILRRMLPR